MFLLFELCCRLRWEPRCLCCAIIFCIRRMNFRLCCSLRQMNFLMRMIPSFCCSCCRMTNCCGCNRTTNFCCMMILCYTMNSCRKMSFCHTKTNCCFCLLKNFLLCSRKKNRLKMPVFCMSAYSMFWCRCFLMLNFRSLRLIC